MMPRESKLLQARKRGPPEHAKPQDLQQEGRAWAQGHLPELLDRRSWDLASQVTRSHKPQLQMR